jgi:hypothetical protein
VSQSRARSSLLLAALLIACAPARDAQAKETGHRAADAKALLADGVHLVRRALGLDRDTAVVSHAVSLSPREAAVEFDLADGTTRVVSLRSGELLVDGRAVGRYRAGGPLERAWRQLLAEAGAKDTHGVLGGLRAFRVAGLSGDDLAAEKRLTAAFRNLTAAAPSATAEVAGAAASSAAAAAIGGAAPALAAAFADSITRALTMADVATLENLEKQLQTVPDIGPDVAGSVRTSPLHLGSFTVPANQRVESSLVVFRGNADVYGTVTGNVVALLGDVVCHDGGSIEGNAVSVGGHVVEAGGTIHGDIKSLSVLGRDLAAQERRAERRSVFDRLFQDVGTVVAVFIALAMVGFGTVFFGRRHVEVVADTASHSFGRSFVVGLLGQLLLLPVFAMMIVGLVLTIVGILVLPFAIVAYVLGAALAALGGYLAVAHAVGETVTRRRMANGAFVRSPNSYGYIFTGLVGLLGLWAAAALFGWLGPVVFLFKVTAVIVTWLAATTGFGAVLLSRAGLRETFAGRYSGEMTDEYLWATPPATPTAARMGRQP